MKETMPLKRLPTALVIKSVTGIINFKNSATFSAFSSRNSKNFPSKILPINLVIASIIPPPGTSFFANARPF